MGLTCPIGGYYQCDKDVDKKKQKASSHNNRGRFDIRQTHFRMCGCRVRKGELNDEKERALLTMKGVIQGSTMEDSGLIWNREDVNQSVPRVKMQEAVAIVAAAYYCALIITL